MSAKKDFQVVKVIGVVHHPQVIFETADGIRHHQVTDKPNECTEMVGEHAVLVGEPGMVQSELKPVNSEVAKSLQTTIKDLNQEIHSLKQRLKLQENLAEAKERRRYDRL